MSGKNIVRYKDKLSTITVGYPALVFPVDHTSSEVSNTTYAQTSIVIKYDEDTGEFETLNSIYKPVESV